MAFRIGDAVQIERDGEWNPGRVVEILDDGNYRVSFDPVAGYEDLEDEDVEPDRVRAPQDASPAPPTPPATPAPPRWVAQTANRWRDCPRPDLEERFEEVLENTVRALRDAGSDAAERTAITRAIGAFYDVRQSAGQPRREYAMHFFWADGVGLDGAHAPLPTRLRETDPMVRDRWINLFNKLVREVE